MDLDPSLVAEVNSLRADRGIVETIEETEVAIGRMCDFIRSKMTRPIESDDELIDALLESLTDDE
jgi:hypothetical protein